MLHGILPASEFLFCLHFSADGCENRARLRKKQESRTSEFTRTPKTEEGRIYDDTSSSRFKIIKRHETEVKSIKLFCRVLILASSLSFL